MPEPKHNYRTCREPDCPRLACQAYREGYQDGHADGFAEGEAAGYAAGG